MPGKTLSEVLKREVGQHLVVGFHGTEVSSDIKTLIRDYFVGSVILMKRNIKDAKQTQQLVQSLQKLAKDAGHKKPLLVGIDQENGLVSAFSSPTAGTQFPGAMALASAGPPEISARVSVASAAELKMVGINWVYSPVADVNTNPRNPVIGVRSFGEDPAKVAIYTDAVVRGHAASGVASTAKHFPGHGDTHVDSHLALPVISKTKEQLYREELVPFKPLIEKGVPSIMTGHMALPLVTGNEDPCSLSKVITALLREEMGYQGIIVTDCLEMDAISEAKQGGCGTEEGTLRAIQAGADVAMICHTFSRQKGAIERLYLALTQGQLDWDLLKASGERVKTMKESFAGDWESCLNTESDWVDRFQQLRAENQKLSKEVYSKTTKVIWNNARALPLKQSMFEGEKQLLLLTPEIEAVNRAVDSDDGTVEGAEDGVVRNTAGPSFLTLAKELAKRVKKLKHIVYGHKIQTSGVISSDIGAVVFLLRNADLRRWQLDFLDALELENAGIPVVLVSSCGPYDLSGIEHIYKSWTGYVFYKDTASSVAAKPQSFVLETKQTLNSSLSSKSYPMKRLFGHKPKSSKPSKDFGEELPKQPQFSTPLYQKLATQGAQVHGSNISQPSLQHSTQQIPSPSEDEWSISHQQAVPPAQQQPYPPPPIIHTPSRSNSLNSIPHMPAASLPPPPRSASPMSSMSMGGTRSLRPHDQDRKVAPSALGILGALNPPKTDGSLSGGRVYSDERSRTETITPSESGHSHHGHKQAPSEREREKDKERKKGFWSRDKEKEKEREKEREREREREKEWQREMQQRKEEYDRGQKDRPRDGAVRRDDDPQDELTRMIGYLTATASEDWSLVLEVCERASANEASAKEAVRALRREFKYGEPAAQLSAARLWAIMLRNSSDMFITQSTSRKFLDTLEDLLSSTRTSPVVRERLLEVVGAAAYASGSKKGNDRDGFKGLWRRVKPFDKPEEGVPFDTDDSMFQPPQSGRQSGYEVPMLNYQEASPLPAESNPATPTPRPIKDRKSPSRGDRIIPRDEDIRRLFQECKIGQGNAGVLSDALIGARPEDLKTEVIKEFYSKCCASQELIYAQIPWATSIAEHSRLNKLRPAPQHARKRTMSSEKHLNLNDTTTTTPTELTIEEQLLAELLAANANLMDVLSQWQDLNRVAIERKVEHRSKTETGRGRKEYESSISTLDSSLIDHIPPSRSHSPIYVLPQHHAAPPSTYSNHSRQPSLQDHDSDTSLPHQQSFAPPPSAPHGPRLPVPAIGPSRSRTPSPVRTQYSNGSPDTVADSNSSISYEEEEPPQPSAKALGKRKVVEPEVTPDHDFDPDDIYYSNGRVGQSSRESTIGPGEDSRWRPPQAKFVYDAVAERTRQLMVESKPPTGQNPKRVNGVH